jgi:hypothetical protein
MLLENKPCVVPWTGTALIIANATPDPSQWERAMSLFVHDANIALYRKLIAESEQNPSRDENRHQMLLKLLAEEIAKDKKAA